MASVVEPNLKTRRWRRVEYERLVDLGIFVGERLELLDILRPPATVTPLAAPGVQIPLADLLP